MARLAMVLTMGTGVAAADEGASPGAVAAHPPAAMDVEACVAEAVRVSPKVAEVAAHVQGFAARLREVEAVFYPKLTGMLYAAPMFTVRGSGYSPDVEVRWRALSDWRPFTNLELILAQPLYTFGRAAAGKRAAQARVEVERARLQTARNAVALEVRRLYYTQVFARSLLPMLTQAVKMVNDAVERARELHEQATGEVTQVDLAKLEYGASEAERLLAVATDGAALALAALAHTMGRGEAAGLVLADAVLTAPDEAVGPSLASWMQRATENRPEWAELAQGRRAALALEEAERLANWPVVFAAGQLRVSRAWSRDKDTNPWHVDNFNGLGGGVAVGFKFDVDPALAQAKGDGARATLEGVEALGRFAATGIPLQVRRAHTDVERHRRLARVCGRGVAATKRWLSFGANAYNSGTGEARDLLEGLVAYLQARRTFFETVLGYQVASAELMFAAGQGAAAPAPP